MFDRGLYKNQVPLPPSRSRVFFILAISFCVHIISLAWNQFLSQNIPHRFERHVLCGLGTTTECRLCLCHFL